MTDSLVDRLRGEAHLVAEAVAGRSDQTACHEAANVLTALEGALTKAAEDFDYISTWRRDAHAHDEDMGHDLRIFDEEDIEMIEKSAQRAASKIRAALSLLRGDGK